MFGTERGGNKEGRKRGQIFAVSFWERYMKMREIKSSL